MKTNILNQKVRSSEGVKNLNKSVAAWLPSCLAAFTLAEVLITIGVIGVVAAITIPTLIQNHKKTVVTSKLRKLSSVVSQAYNSAYLETGIYPSHDCDDTCFLANDADIAYDVFNKYYTPYLKGVIVEKGEKGVFAYLPDDSALYFRRTSVCGTSKTSWSCAYMIACISHKACKNNVNEDKSQSYTLGGNGKDVFLLDTSGRAPSYAGMHYSREELLEQCKNGTGIEACTAIIVGDGWKISDDYPIRL